MIKKETMRLIVEDICKGGGPEWNKEDIIELGTIIAYERVQALRLPNWKHGEFDAKDVLAGIRLCQDIAYDAIADARGDIEDACRRSH